MQKNYQTTLGNSYHPITPENCLNLSFQQSLNMIRQILTENEFQKAFDITRYYPSPILKLKSKSWTQTIKIIGINPRMTKTYWGIIKYAMTFPENGIHIMPLWETGDGSLYVQNSWELNRDFYDDDLALLGYDTCESQLKLTVNILHALGKLVGFDTLPHVDNFSEIVILNPKYFEWVKLNHDKTSQIFDINPDLIYKEVEKFIIDYLLAPINLFELSENERKKIIFPENTDKFKRRMELRKLIRDSGFEPVPVVEHSPMRPILFDKIESSQEENWAVFRVPNKSHKTKILGAVTPYKWYKIDSNGYPVKNTPELQTWDYFMDKINEFQKEYNFDFLRADMAHNQISHSHRGEKDLHNIELWDALKQKIQEQKPYFATFAESFYNTYYIDGLHDMQNKNFDIVLGNMNFKHIDKNYFNWIYDFLNPFRDNFCFHPCVTVFTNDGDLPEHNQYFSSIKDNQIRYFISLFLDLPSYMGIGYETRNIDPKISQEFSNIYVRPQSQDYSFGNNIELFNFITKMRTFYLKYRHIIENNKCNFINTENTLSLTWGYINEQNEIQLLFIISLNKDIDLEVSDDFKSIYSNGYCFIYE